MVKEDMAEVEVTEEDTEDRNNWIYRKSAVATHDGKSRKKKNKFTVSVLFSMVFLFHVSYSRS